MRDFIGIKLGDEWLDLPEDLTIQVEDFNPLFETDRIPGGMTFPFTLPFSSLNNRKLGFPGHLSMARYRQPQLDCQLFLMGQLWNVGKLNIRKRTSKGYEVNFQTGVGDISTLIKEQSLIDLPLGSEPLVLDTNQDTYALFPVWNPDFFEEKPEFFNGYINYFDGGFTVSPANPMFFYHPITPFPYLVHVLRKVMAVYGYSVSGSWIDDPETTRLVIYNTHALFPESAEDPLTPVVIASHLPDMKVNEFLKALRSLFSLAMVFNPTRKQLEIFSLKEVLADRTYVEWTGNTGKVYDWEPTSMGGFTLQMTPDSGDDLQKDNPSLTYVVGAGKETISCQVSTLGMAQHYVHPNSGNFKKWLVPETSQKTGASSFRILSYRGLQPDENEMLYPLGTSGTQDFSGASIGTDSLQWAGPTGLYERRHKPWLDFLAEYETIHTEQVFKIKDVLSLDSRRRSYIRHEMGTFTGLWEKVSFSVSRKKGLLPAKVPLRKII